MLQIIFTDVLEQFLDTKIAFSKLLGIPQSKLFLSLFLTNRRMSDWKAARCVPVGYLDTWPLWTQLLYETSRDRHFEIVVTGSG